MPRKKKRSTTAKDQFDPSCFGDPIAEKAKWTPAVKGGTNSRTQRLVRVSPDRVEVRWTWLCEAGACFFVLLCLVLMYVASTRLVSDLQADSSGRSLPGKIMFRLDRIGTKHDTVLPVFICLSALTVASLVLLHFSRPTACCDKRKGLFWRGRKAPDLARVEATIKPSPSNTKPRKTEAFFHFEGSSKGTGRNWAKLEDIHALQIISEYCRIKSADTSGSTSRTTTRAFFSHELNLVLEDAKRINVIDHGNLTKLRKDAQALAEFLEKPLWDAPEFGQEWDVGQQPDPT
ncbi:MAG: hypothetical protein HON70_25600 [Lentisphaerae bacterium]|nr:hypothetical protein [Lentisphaerota bacterium]